MRKISRARKTSAVWAGSLDDLERIAGILATLGADAINLIEADSRATSVARKAEYAREWSVIGAPASAASWKALEKNRAARVRSALAVRVRARHSRWDRLYDGTPEEVLSELDPRDLVALLIEIGGHQNEELRGYHAYVSFDRDRGCRAILVGSETKWMLQGADDIGEELRRGRPWYSFLRRKRAIVPFLVALGALSIFPVIAQVFTNPLLGAVVALSAGIVVGILGTITIRKIVPSFEVHANGARARSAQTLAVIVGVVGWVASVAIGLIR